MGIQGLLKTFVTDHDKVVLDLRNDAVAVEMGGLIFSSVLKCLDLERAERLAHHLRGKLLLTHGELVNLSAFCVRHVANILAQVSFAYLCFEGAPYEPKTSGHEGMSRLKKADKVKIP